MYDLKLLARYLEGSQASAHPGRAQQSLLVNAAQRVPGLACMQARCCRSPQAVAPPCLGASAWPHCPCSHACAAGNAEDLCSTQVSLAVRHITEYLTLRQKKSGYAACGVFNCTARGCIARLGRSVQRRLSNGDHVLGGCRCARRQPSSKGACHMTHPVKRYIWSVLWGTW